MKSVEGIYNEINKYLKLDKKYTTYNIATNIDVKDPLNI